MLFEFGKHIVDIDVEATRSYYINTMPENDCNCSGCINFRKYADMCDNRIRQMFSDMGIDDMKRIYEIIPYEETVKDYENNGGNLYGGFFHVVGSVVTKPEVPSESGLGIVEDSSVKLTESFELCISESISLIPRDFPLPALQIELFAYIPWLLDGKNNYLC